MDGLRISPKYSSDDWSALSIGAPADWTRAVDMVRDRLEGRFLRFVDSWLSDAFSGFIVLAVDSLLAETIQQFRAGETDGRGKSQQYIKEFLSGPRFQADFDEDAKKRFYLDIRCGLLHQAEAKEMWLVRRGQKAMLQTLTSSKGYIIDVPRFHAAVQESLQDYYLDITDPSEEDLRSKLWKKMDHLSRIRTARGLLYEAEGNAKEA
jgi:hypothetical protein